MAENWTKGPWAARWVKDGNKRHLVNIVQDTRPLARILAPLPQWFLDEDLDSEEYRVHAANANMMAAAPDLYEACESLLAFMAGYASGARPAGFPEYPVETLARAALSKARGESNG